MKVYILFMHHENYSEILHVFLNRENVDNYIKNLSFNGSIGDSISIIERPIVDCNQGE